MDDIYYPRLLRRVQAMLIDSVLMGLLLYAIAFLPPMGEWSFVKPVLFVAGIFILDPGLESFTGGTIGHHWMKLRVTRLSGEGNISLIAATIRFVVKVMLGWFSLVLVLTTRRHQALHDMAARSVVVYRSTNHLPAYEKLVDRSSLSDTYLMPSRWRRTVVTSAYFVAWYLCYAFTTALLVSELCLSHRTCSAAESTVLGIGSIVWMFGACAIIVWGWRGQLYGSRRQLRG